MHSLLDRGTILAGLVDELRPLLPPLGGALGDLCAGIGGREAADQALEIAFMIRAAGEMLDLAHLRESGAMLEAALPLLSGAPPDVLQRGVPVVQSLLTAVERATDNLVKSGEPPDESLEAARRGLDQLREAHGRAQQTLDGSRLGVMEMLATLEVPPRIGDSEVAITDQPPVEEQTLFTPVLATGDGPAADVHLEVDVAGSLYALASSEESAAAVDTTELLVLQGVAADPAAQTNHAPPEVNIPSRQMRDEVDPRPEASVPTHPGELPEAVSCEAPAAIPVDGCSHESADTVETREAGDPAAPLLLEWLASASSAAAQGEPLVAQDSPTQPSTIESAREGRQPPPIELVATVGPEEMAALPRVEALHNSTVSRIWRGLRGEPLGAPSAAPDEEILPGPAMATDGSGYGPDVARVEARQSTADLRLPVSEAMPATPDHPKVPGYFERTTAGPFDAAPVTHKLPEQDETQTVFADNGCHAGTGSDDVPECPSELQAPVQGPILDSDSRIEARVESLPEPALAPAEGASGSSRGSADAEAVNGVTDNNLAPRAPVDLPDSLRETPGIEPEILEVFFEEASEVLTALGECLQSLEADPTDRHSAAELRRASHTLKGAANVVGFPSIGLVCKAMEELLDALSDAGAPPDSAALRFLTESCEAIRALVPNPVEAGMLARAAELAAQGAELVLSVGVVAGSPESYDRSDDAAAWDRAVDRFLADSPERDAAPETAKSDHHAEHVSADRDATQFASHSQTDETQEESSELLSVFVAETEEHLAALSSAALRLDLDLNDTTALDEARRALHTMKGSASVLSLEVISGLCHETETSLEHEDLERVPRLLFEAAEKLELVHRQVATSGRETLVELVEPLSLPEAVFLEPSAATPSEAAGAGTPVEIRPEHSAVSGEDTVAAGSMVRVDLSRVDDVLNVVGEVVLTRSGLEQRLDRVGRASEELRLTVARLRRIAHYLEDRYEVAELLRTGPEERLNSDFDELELDRYTELHRVSREMTELAADAETTSDELELALKELDTLASRQGRLSADLQDKLMALRLVPLSSLATRLLRTVRSVGLKRGKDVELVIQGGQTELDKRVVEELGDILLHLIRNAVDHGIESPEDRGRTGKAAVGAVSLRAYREGSEAVVELSDDGAGVNLVRLRRRAEVNGLIKPDQEIEPQALLDLIFHPGLSTSTTPTEVSGRGVGLDAVRTAVTRLKGTVEVTSQTGRCTTFTLRLPVVLAVLQAMLVKAGEQTYAIQINALERVLRTATRPVVTLGRAPTIELDDGSHPFLDLGATLGRASQGRTDGPTPMLVVRARDRRVAVAVDELLGQQELVVKSLGPHLRSVRGVLGATVQPNGHVVLVLNTTELFTTRALAMGGVTRGMGPPPTSAETKLTALVVDDSLSVRKVLARSLERDGWEVRLARDGVDALEVLQSFRPDVVLMDIEMPRMDGFELTGILRDVTDYGNPPVVMITSRAGEKHRKRAEDLGVAAYMVKPYQEAELVAAVRQAAMVGAGS